MNPSLSEPCSLSLHLVSLRRENQEKPLLGPPRFSSQVSVALPQQLLYVVLCVLGYTSPSKDSCRSWLAMRHVTSLRPVQNRLAQTG